MICPICGALNHDNVQYCNACGNYLHPQQSYQQPNYQQPNYQQQNYHQPYYPQPQKKDPGKVLGIVGFALAMASLVLSDGFILAIVGIILSAMGKKRSREAGFTNTFAQIGFITGIIVTIISAIVLAVILVLYLFFFALTYSSI